MQSERKMKQASQLINSLINRRCVTWCETVFHEPPRWSLALTCACHILLALSLTLIPAAPLRRSASSAQATPALTPVNEHTCSPSLQSSPGITFTSSTLAPPARPGCPLQHKTF